MQKSRNRYTTFRTSIIATECRRHGDKFFGWSALTYFLVCAGAIVSFDSTGHQFACTDARMANEVAWFNASATMQPSPDEEQSDATRATFDWIQSLGGRAANEATPGGEVWRVSFDLTPLTDGQLAQLSTSAPIVAISLARTAVSDQGLCLLTPQANLAVLNLFQTNVTDKGMATIGEILALQSLYLQRTKVTDEGVPYLLYLTALRHLALDETSVTDSGMIALAGLPELRHVSLRGTAISDVGLMTLGQSASLEMIVLTGTRVTSEGIERLRRLRPELQIVN